MIKFELQISLEGAIDVYDEYIAGPIVVICDGVNITTHENSPSKSIIGDHYFSLFEMWLDALVKVLNVEHEVICPVVDNPYNFIFKRINNDVEVSVHHIALGSKFDKKMGGPGRPIAVPLADFIDEVLQKAEYFIKLMLKKNPNIANNWEFKEIQEKKEAAKKAWVEYKKKKLKK
jgi:hypothetical protein